VVCVAKEMPLVKEGSTKYMSLCYGRNALSAFKLRLGFGFVLFVDIRE